VLSDAALDVLRAHVWPGNCRELRSALRSAALLAGSDAIRPGHLPSCLARVGSLRVSAKRGVSSLEAMELQHILSVLESTGGNRSSAARLLGIDRGTLARKLEGVRPPNSSPHRP